MLMRTHLAIGMFLALFFLPYVNEGIWFFISIVLITSLIPDIDLMHSKIGDRGYLRPIQWIVKHRGIIHSFTICIFISVIFSLYLPKLALPFFLGYSFHLLADSFTIDGIRPFWPSKKEIKGAIKVGGKIEKGIFWVLVLIILFLVLRIFMR